MDGFRCRYRVQSAYEYGTTRSVLGNLNEFGAGAEAIGRQVRVRSDFGGRLQDIPSIDAWADRQFLKGLSRLR